MANPNLTDPNQIFAGESIFVPFGNIVKTNISYTYSIMESNILALSTIYPFLQVFHIGNSVLGKRLPVIRLGIGSKEVFYNASFHANEWITSVVLMKFVEDYAKAYTVDNSIFNYRIRELFRSVSIYILPMVNPDGVDLVTGAIPPSSTAYQSAYQIANSYPDIPFPSGWKANIRGVDLNLQFPARMGKCKRN